MPAAVNAIGNRLCSIVRNRHRLHTQTVHEKRLSARKETEILFCLRQLLQNCRSGAKCRIHRQLIFFYKGRQAFDVVCVLVCEQHRRQIRNLHINAVQRLIERAHRHAQINQHRSLSRLPHGAISRRAGSHGIIKTH